MGAAMAGHLLDAGHSLCVYNRTKSKATGLVARGAAWRDSPALVARECSVVFTMVGYPSDVEEVHFGAAGIIANAPAGALLVDATTSSPALARRIHEAASAAGMSALDAPVSGGDTGARNATLSIMVGGDQPAFERARPFLEKMGKTIVLLGPAGAGQHTKMCNQIALAGSLMGTIESFTYAKAAGLDPRAVLQAIGGGAAGSWQMANNGPRMLDGNFAPGFYAKHFLKDLRIALASAREMHLALPQLALAETLFDRLCAQGMEDSGTQALYILYERGLA